MNRSPGLAGVLSVVLPGLGHLYAGATARGLALAAAFVALLQDELVAAVLAVWIFGIVNAIRTTEEVVRAHAEGRPADVSLDRNWAVGLMGAGVIATLAMIPELEWALRLWPLLLVWIGFQLFRGHPLIPGGSQPRSGGSPAASAPPEPPPVEPLEDAPLIPGNEVPGDEDEEPTAGKDK